MTVRLERDEKLYGFMSVSTADQHADLAEELSLFDEVAGDVSLALHQRHIEADRERAIEALRRSESTLAEAQRIACVGNWDWVIETNALHWSDEIYRIFGLAPQEFSATYEAFLERVHPEDRARVDAAVEAATRSAVPYDIVHRIVHPNGDERTVRERAEVGRDAHGTPIRMIGTVQDITDQKRTEEELLQYRERLEDLVARRTAELEEANSELEMFVYTVSHDLRAPLRGINTLTEIILEDYADAVPDDLAGYLHRLTGAADRMNRMVDALLGLSRVARAEISVEHVDLTTEAHQVLDELTRDHPEREIVRSVCTDMSIRGDPTLLRLVLDNLLGNAWKFTAREPVARVTVGCREIDGESVYFVNDNGTGFDSARADRLFHPFQRLHHQRDYPGTGIGLATVERIIRRHGGRVWAEGKLGAGATFYFTVGEIDAPGGE
jgi:PAS domain S-box-containing protein